LEHTCLELKTTPHQSFISLDAKPGDSPVGFVDVPAGTVPQIDFESVRRKLRSLEVLARIAADYSGHSLKEFIENGLIGDVLDVIARDLSRVVAVIDGKADSGSL
jgi:hypothetical protein